MTGYAPRRLSARTCSAALASIRREQPAVIAAPYTAVLAAAVFQRRATVRTEFMDQPHRPGFTVAKQHQLFAQNLDRLGQLTEVFRHEYRMPEASQVFATGCAGSDTRKLFVDLGRVSLLIATKSGRKIIHGRHVIKKSGHTKSLKQNRVNSRRAAARQSRLKPGRTLYDGP